MDPVRGYSLRIFKSKAKSDEKLTISPHVSVLRRNTCMDIWGSDDSFIFTVLGGTQTTFMETILNIKKTDSP